MSQKALIPDRYISDTTFEQLFKRCNRVQNDCFCSLTGNKCCCFLLIWLEEQWSKYWYNIELTTWHYAQSSTEEPLQLTCHESWEGGWWPNFWKSVIVVWAHVTHSLFYNFAVKHKNAIVSQHVKKNAYGIISFTAIPPTWQAAGSGRCPVSWTACTCSFHEVGAQ